MPESGTRACRPGNNKITITSWCLFTRDMTGDDSFVVAVAVNWFFAVRAIFSAPGPPSPPRLFMVLQGFILAWLHDDAPPATTAVTIGLLVVFFGKNRNQYQSSDLNIVSGFSYPLQLRKLKFFAWDIRNRDDAKPSIFGNHQYALAQNLKSLKQALKGWNKQVFGDIRLKVGAAELLVQKSQDLLDVGPSDYLHQSLAEAKAKGLPSQLPPSSRNSLAQKIQN
ncbi:hypothetical protein AAC387_Pa03g3797 [Persea americana]